jgi:hypothetical protein
MVAIAKGAKVLRPESLKKRQDPRNQTSSWDLAAKKQESDVAVTDYIGTHSLELLCALPPK